MTLPSPLFVSGQILPDAVLEAVKMHWSFGTLWLYNRHFSGAFLTYVMSAGIERDGSWVLLFSESNLISWKTSVEGFSDRSILCFLENCFLNNFWSNIQIKQDTEFFSEWFRAQVSHL